MSAQVLVLGPRRYLDATAPLAPDDPLVLLPVPAAACSGTDFAGAVTNSVHLDWNRPARVSAQLLTGPDSTDLGTVDWRAAGSGLRVGPEIAGAVRAAGSPADDLTPLFVLAEQDGGAHVWSRIRLGLGDALFVRVTATPLLVPGGTTETIRAASSLHREHALFLNNHQCYYRNMFEGEEIEHKYTLDPATDIWSATVDLYHRVRDGELPGFRPEYGDEFQSWDYLNHLFEVPGPPQEQGYASFIPLSTGGFTIKRKWFAQDAVRRGERHYREPGQVPDMAGYLRERFAVDVVELPPFRRVRYDINFESVVTGHLYGIYFDHSRLVDHPDVALVQCELEYMRTRSVLPVREEDVLHELETLARWLEDHFDQRSVRTTRGTYSKLSFLRDSVRAMAGEAS